MIGTAEITAPADVSRPTHGRGALLGALFVTATMAGCGSGAHTYGVGEGARVVVGYQLAYIDGGGAAELGHPTTAVEPWASGCRQLFAGGRSRTAALLQQPCGDNQQVFAVSGDFWQIYRSTGERAPALYGFPLGPRAEWEGGWTQGFGRPGSSHAMLMQRRGGEPHVVSAPVLGYYLSFDDRHVRFGFPTGERVTTADGRRCQEFEHGVVVVTADDEHMTFDKVDAGQMACRPSS